MTRTGSLRFVAAALVALGAAACGGGSEESGGGGGRPVEVTAADFAFDPTTIEAEPGEEIEVTLVNEDDAPHTFTIDDLDAETEAGAGESASVTFTAPDEGSVEFHCHFHPDMVGTLTVDGSPVEGGGGHETGEHGTEAPESEETDEGETDTGKY